MQRDAPYTKLGEEEVVVVPSWCDVLFCSCKSYRLSVFQRFVESIRAHAGPFDDAHPHRHVRKVQISAREALRWLKTTGIPHRVAVKSSAIETELCVEFALSEVVL